MRAPDLIIGNPESPVYYRWQLFKIRGFQLCLHKWLRSDEDRALHDHSGDSISFILNGGYLERRRERGTWLTSEVAEHEVTRWCRPWWPVFRKAETPHRVILTRIECGGRDVTRPVWSLWFRWPPRREWGFHCPKGWRHWKDFCASRDDYYKTKASVVGKGCDD
jgi:hypothetical protein